MIFVDGGRSFQCNFCLAATEVPGHFFCNLDHTGKRHDLPDRKELTCGSVEYAANKVGCVAFFGPFAFLIESFFAPNPLPRLLVVLLLPILLHEQTYCSREPAPCSYLFVIDVSYNSVNTGLLGAVTQAIRQVLDDFPKAEGDEVSPTRVRNPNKDKMNE